jgi:plasmid stabilization system protein ParE
MDTAIGRRPRINCGIHRCRLSAYASLFVLDIISAVDRLESFPGMGRVVPETNDESSREIIFGNYRIVYRLKSDLIELLTIYHGSRLLDPSALD